MAVLTGSTQTPEKLRSEGRSTLYRTRASADAPAMLAWVVADVHVHGDTRVRLERELALRDLLDCEWAARPVGLIAEPQSLTLLLTDPGGEPLSRMVDAPWEPVAFLRVAVGITVALGRAHKSGLIHRNIAPANILIDRASGTAWLTGFGFASRQSQEVAFAPPDVIAGTLAYMAPEQTGRMNRPVDARSDLYALGAVFYQMLSGELPFNASDSLEWVHCHVARHPQILAERTPSLPTTLSDIVMKLLAKTGDERYQTAAGLEADLRRCAEALSMEGRIGGFRLGSHDRGRRLLLPETLYGREREIASLLSAFERVARHGRPELTVVSGHAGIGKSAVVDELRKLVAPKRAIFVAAKSDRLTRDTPYSALAEGLRGLVRDVLGDEFDELAQWKELVREAVGVQGVLLFQLFPKLEPLIGPLPLLPTLSVTEDRQRFQSVFRGFVGAFARKERPLVIFLDDLQWLDAASLELIQGLVLHPDTRYLHVVGAYRDDEVRPDDPFMTAIASIRSGGCAVGRLDLDLLDVDDVTRLVREALGVEPSATCSLGALVHSKTDGNPFFARQFLASLDEEELLRFDRLTNGWQWDDHVIDGKAMTENVVALVVRRLLNLPPSAQAVLKLLSCLGSQANVQTLALLAGPQETVHEQFRAAMEAGVVVFNADRYRFVHDRVQEAAYALIPVSERSAMHLGLGKSLARAWAAEQGDEHIFDIANQLNAGQGALADAADRIIMAELNLRSGRRAQASAAYAAASKHFACGLEALGKEGGSRHHELSFALRRQRAECEVSRANLGDADLLIDDLLAHARSKVDAAQGAVLRMTLQLIRGHHDRAVRTALAELRLLGQEFPERCDADHMQAEYESMCDAMRNRAIESLADLPLMDNPEVHAAMTIMVQLGRASFATDKHLFGTLVCRLVKLTLHHGVSESSTHGCGGVGTLLGPVFQRHADGVRFARAAIDIAERRGYAAHRPGAYLAMEMTFLWSRPVSEALACVDRSLAVAKEAGALLFAGIALEHRLTDLLFRGDPLGEVWNEGVASLSFADTNKLGSAAVHIRSVLAFVRALRGRPDEVAEFDDVELDAGIDRCRVPNVVCFHWILRMQRQCLLGDAAGSLAFASKAAFNFSATQSQIQSVDFRVFESLAMADAYPALDAQRQADCRKVIEVNLAALKCLADSNAPSFLHKHALIAGEQARIDGRDLEALTLVEKALKSASDNGFMPDAALAAERAARLCLSLGLETAAWGHLREARERYLRWGALAKVALLDALHPGIFPTATEAAPRIIDASVEQLDLAAIVRMSQALSSEIVADRLIEKLMVIAVEHAGAERGLLILQKDTGLHLEATAFSSRGGVVVQRLSRHFVPSDLPATIVLHVARSGQGVILDDAIRSDLYSGDEYIRDRTIRSVLCLPLMHQGELVGVLYFENNFASHVFTPARHMVLDLLSSQAAISLQNAELYARLETENAERRQSEAALRRSEERYALAVEAATDGHADWTVGDDVFYVSTRLLEQWGIAPEVPITTRQQMLDAFPFHPDDRDRVLALLDEHRRGTTKRLEFDARVIRRGEVRWMHCAILYLRDAASGLLRTSVATADVTERMRAKEQLRQSEERYALALVGSNEGVFDWDLRTDRAYLPARTQELLGLAVGDPWRTREEWETLLVYHPGDRERMQAALEAHFVARTPYDHEVRFIKAGGEIRWFRARGTSLRDADGTPYRFVGSLGDITERKRQQEEMVRLESRLRQAERFEAMGTLAGGIAHDFNNILGAILGFGERALRAVREGSRMHHDLENVVMAGERGRALVDRILSFSRGTAGERVPVNAERAVREALNLLRAKLPRHVRLRTNLHAGRAAILGDVVQVHQLLMNLGTNAAHAMTQPGTLTVSLDVVDVAQSRQARVGALGAGTWIVLRVADQGIGMTPDILDRIFDPFFTTKDIGVGTGLGLSLVLRIVTQSAGAIDVESTPNEGSIFSVYLPCAGEALEESRDDRPQAPHGQGHRVMVVDDDEALLELTVDALREMGYEPAGYGSARAALESFRASPGAFDVLITDLRMPGMAGDTFIREVRSVRPLLPVILVSGYGGDVAQAPFFNSGWADEVLTKPLRRNALATSLARVLDIT